MGKTKFQDKWILEYPFLQPVKNDCYSAFCTICLRKFKIDGSGVSQVKSHAKCHKKSSTVSLSGQRTLVVNSSGSSAEVTLSKQPVIKQSLSPEDLILNAEILQALHYVLNENGDKKFPQLFALVKCVLSVSHGNATPERGFSINKLILQHHGSRLGEHTLVSLRTTKDELCRIGGELNFPLTKELRNAVKNAYANYKVHQAEKEALRKKEEEIQKRKDADAAEKEKRKTELQEINNEISKLQSYLQAANEIIHDGKESLDKALQAKTLNRNDLQAAHSKMEVGLERKRKLEDQLNVLGEKKRKLK